MNVKELKKLARDWDAAIHDVTRSAFSEASAMRNAIMALPDDYQLVDVNKVIGEHQDLVEMARMAIKAGHPIGRDEQFCELASAVIERFGKREPQTFVKYEVRSDNPTFPSVTFQSKEAALGYVRNAITPYRVFKITGTEEV